MYLNKKKLTLAPGQTDTVIATFKPPSLKDSAAPFYSGFINMCVYFSVDLLDLETDDDVQWFALGPLLRACDNLEEPPQCVLSR